MNLNPEKPFVAGQNGGLGQTNSPAVDQNHFTNAGGSTQSPAPAEGFAPTGPARKPFPFQTVALAFMLVVTAGGVLGMRHLGHANGMTMEEVSFNYTPPTDELNRTYARIMDDLARAQRPLTVTLSEVQDAPFSFVKPHRVAQAATPFVTPVVNPMDALHRQLTGEAEMIKLQSVLGGKVPIARIDGETLKVGDTINETFVIKTIDAMARTVTLVPKSTEGAGMEFTLTMERPEDKMKDKDKKKSGKVPSSPFNNRPGR
jgi:hypothetical protein